MPQYVLNPWENMEDNLYLNKEHIHFNHTYAICYDATMQTELWVQSRLELHLELMCHQQSSSQLPHLVVYSTLQFSGK